MNCLYVVVVVTVVMFSNYVLYLVLSTEDKQGQTFLLLHQDLPEVLQKIENLKMSNYLRLREIFFHIETHMKVHLFMGKSYLVK